jgi:hypothetical protein
MNYILKIYDEPLVKFRLYDDIGLKAGISWVSRNLEELMPLGMDCTDEGIVKWLQRRAIPRNRANVGRLLLSMGLSSDDRKGLVDISKALSLNDSYWVVSEDFSGSFKDFNLYENSFSEILALVAYTGQSLSFKGNSSSPEWTTNGMLPKAWRRTPEGIFLYKGGTSGASNAGREPFSEFHAAQIASLMDIDAVSYTLEEWEGILSSKCRLFTDIDTAFVPIGAIVDGGIEECIRYMDGIGSSEQIRDMLAFDAVIYNEDRHFGNFGVLRDNHTGRVLRMAPLFDQGNSLFCHAAVHSQTDVDDYRDISSYARTLDNPYRASYDELCHKYLERSQYEKLEKLSDLELGCNNDHDLPMEHLDAIRQQVIRRAGQLLSLR